MKKIILSLVIFVSAFFCFEINGRADLTCTYTIEDPFTYGDNNSKTGYYNYMYNLISTYFYSLNGNIDEFESQRNSYLNNYKNYLSSIQSGTGNLTKWKDPVNIKGVELTAKFYNQLTYISTDLYAYTSFTLKYQDNEGKTRKMAYFTKKKYDGTKCPDLILYDGLNGSKGYAHNVYQIYESIDYKLIDFELRNIFGKKYDDTTQTFYSETYSKDLTLSYFYFMSDELKRGTTGLMYILWGRNEAAYRYHQNVLNIGDVVDKYSSIKEILDDINELLDKTYGQSTLTEADYDILNSYLPKVIDKIVNGELKIESLLTIGNQLEKLHEFNDDIFDNGCSGLNNCLNNMLVGTGYKSKDWFDMYMPDSKEQYVEALIYVLEYIQQNYGYISEYKSVNEFKEQLADASTDDEVENLCNGNKHVIVRSLCINELKDNSADEGESSYLDSYYDCSNTMTLPENYCEDKEKDDLIDDIEKSLEKFEEANSNLSIWYSKKNMEQKGFDTDAVDFCDILKTDLIDYIKIVMNIIRIGGPILIIFLTGFDVIKMIASFNDDESKKFWKNLKIRLICLVILILVPTIINWIINLLIKDACIVNV